MIRLHDRIREMEAVWERSLYSNMNYPEALARFTALWHQARLLNPRVGQSWEEDVKPDIVLARILNGLSPHT